MFEAILAFAVDGSNFSDVAHCANLCTACSSHHTLFLQEPVNFELRSHFPIFLQFSASFVLKILSYFEQQSRALVKFFL